MQHHPGSWYIPWGVPGMGLQKMLAVPFNPATAGYHQPQIAAAAVQPQPQVQTAAGQQQQAVSQQATAYQHQLQHHHHHPAAALHNPAAAAAAAAMQHQPLHPAAAAAMFTPLTLRSFVTHPHLNLGQQPMAAAAQQPQHTPSGLPGQTTLTLNGAIGAMVPMRQQQQQQQQAGQQQMQQAQQQHQQLQAHKAAAAVMPVNTAALSTSTLIMPMRKVNNNAISLEPSVRQR